MEILGAEGACQFLAVVQNGLAAFFLGRNGDDDDLLGSHAGRADQAVVVGVHHDERTDHAGGDAPGAGPGELLGIVPPGKADVLGLGEVLPQEVGGSGLDGLAVLHHGFHRVGLFRAGEAFRLRFFPGMVGMASTSRWKSS